MIARTLYDQLVPNAPVHRRTETDRREADEPRLRRLSGGLLGRREAIPGLQEPRLVSSYDGSIEQIMFCFPAWAVADPALAAGYRSLIAALRPGTRFVVVHSTSVRDEITAWFADAGHSPESVDLVALPEYVSFTDWAEDGYLALTDVADDSTYLLEPWEFPRAGDALIADAVSDTLAFRSQQAPLIFQGGNCLVGDDFWLLGRDYFADTLALLAGRRPPVELPEGTMPAAFATLLFSDYVDRTRRLVLLGTTREIPLPPLRGSRSAAGFHLDVVGEGVGTYQPIFHIDMFATLMGTSEDGRFHVLVGDPTLADDLLGRTSPWALPEVYDAMADALTAEGLVVHRNPLVHWPTVTQQLSLERLIELATQLGNEDLGPAVAELRSAGAELASPVTVRRWHHITWNNCLVENSTEHGRHVYLPTFGHGEKADLARIDETMTDLWREHGFEVHALGDFNPFAERQGVVHCIKKYLQRS